MQDEHKKSSPLESPHTFSEAFVHWLIARIRLPGLGRFADRPYKICIDWLVVVMTSFAALALSEKVTTSELALTRFTARLYAPITGYFYPSKAHDKIVIIQYDDRFLKTQALSWPISYAAHSDWLERLFVASGAKPKGVFLDIHFGQERAAPGLNELRSTLCKLKNERALPVLLGAIQGPDKQLYVRSGLADGVPCFSLVDISFTPDRIDHIAWNYHLGSLQAPSPALQLAKLQFPVHHEKPMALVWSGKEAPSNQSRDDITTSGDSEFAHFPFRRLIPAALSNFLHIEPAPTPRPYHKRVSMADIEAMEADEIAKLVNGRFVLIAAAIPGYNDFADSPVHGRIGGVFLHAMALDNLLTYQDQYKTEGEWHWPMHDLSLFLAGLATITAMFVVSHLLSKWVNPHAGRAANGFNGWLVQYLHGIWLRLGNALLRVAGWLFKMAVLTLLAALMIVLFQSVTRVGLLPLIELVSITLMAEGLHLSRRVDTFLNYLFFGDPTWLKAAHH